MGKVLELSWVLYDKNMNDPKHDGNAKFKITSFQDLKPSNDKERCRAQLFLSDHRVVIENIKWEEWNNATYVDVDGKFWYTTEDRIKDNPPRFVYNNVYNWIEKHYRANISDAEMSRSGLGFHFYFLWDCKKTEENHIYYNQVAYAIVKKAFVECGYKDMIEFPKVFDNCTESYYQLVYPTKNNWIHNFACTGKLVSYFDLYINQEVIDKKINRSNKKKLEDITGIKFSKNNNYEFNLVRRFDVDKVEYIEHRTRWTLFDSLRYIFTDEQELRYEWEKCCEKIPEQHGHDFQFYCDEPYKQNQSYNWCNIDDDSYCDIELLKKFGYEVKIIKISSNINNIFTDIFGNNINNNSNFNTNKFINNL